MIPRLVTEEDNQELQRPITVKELEELIRMILEDGALRPDGISGVFYLESDKKGCV